MEINRGRWTADNTICSYMSLSCIVQLREQPEANCPLYCTGRVFMRVSLGVSQPGGAAADMMVGNTHIHGYIWN